jgi:hypothetical protein
MTRTVESLLRDTNKFESVDIFARYESLLPRERLHSSAHWLTMEAHCRIERVGVGRGLCSSGVNQSQIFGPGRRPGRILHTSIS